MRKLLKWIGLGVLGLLAATLLLVLVWVASNWHDAEPQPIPAALAAPPAQSGEGGLLALLAAAPPVKSPPDWPSCTGSDCQAAFEGKGKQWASWREEQAGFVAACDSATKVEDLKLGEPLPERWSMSTEFPPYRPLIKCHQWLLMRAWQVGQAGLGSEMLADLQQATHLEQRVRTECQVLAGQMAGINMAARKLQVIAALAPRFPDQRQAMAKLADLSAPDLIAAMRRWVPAEAAFGRANADVLRGDPDASVASLTWLDRLTLQFGHPEFTQQLFDAHWMRVLNCLQGELEAAAECARGAVRSEPGLLPYGMRWRNTVPHLLYDIGNPYWGSSSTYIDRAVDLQRAAQATQAWLRGQPPTTAVEATADGTWTLRLRLRAAGQSNRIPTHWAPLPKDR